MSSGISILDHFESPVVESDRNMTLTGRFCMSVFFVLASDTSDARMRGPQVMAASTLAYSSFSNVSQSTLDPDKTLYFMSII